ncbi:DUF3440 domain-containing protein [Fusobacterium polymorphum]|uniref:Phosphoadenosine phosphosulfate reductase n=1 Tax=Fusobacterium nucleatum subsp. polymorphum TaxID=76857 RepID=A0A2C6AQN7_FUSNP|nr:DUF3440 domain-containing protein [Fusobacterium polymorphum]PHI14200.1 phosphoadenosine phosphosulfate reductase [Fusobacterium polymorphum]
MKIYKDQDVLSAARDRYKFIFNNFDNVCFSFSGGKDSSLMIQLANIVAKKLNKVFDVLYIDLEAQYKHTIDHVYELKELSQIRDFYHIALPLYLRNAVSVLQPKWICWKPEDKELWVRDLPKDSINLINNFLPFYNRVMEFEEFVPSFNKWYADTKGGMCAVGVGIRADESLNRFRTIAIPKNKVMFKNKPWTTQIYKNTFNFYPLYDFKTQDVWGAVSLLDLKYNKIYELMYKNGLSIHEQRLCQPYGDDQRNGLDQFKALEADTWEKILNRVNGVNFGNIYCRSYALGNIKSFKPDFMSWEQYTVFLLESLGLYNRDLMLHYYGKIKKFMEWYKIHENIEIIPQEGDLKLEQQKKIISWRRIARAIERNDFYMKRLSFGENKKDNEKLQHLMKKYNNLLEVKR